MELLNPIKLMQEDQKILHSNFGGYDISLALSLSNNFGLVDIFGCANKSSKLNLIWFYKSLLKIKWTMAHDIINKMIKEWILSINNNKNIQIGWFEIKSQPKISVLPDDKDIFMINCVIKCLYIYCDIWLPKSIFLETSNDWSICINQNNVIYSDSFSSKDNLLYILSELWFCGDYKICEYSKSWQTNQVFLNIYPWYYWFTRFVK